MSEEAAQLDIDDVFESTEELFIRYTSSQFPVTIESLFKFSEQSANRSKYSGPAEVRRTNEDVVTAISVGDLPTQEFSHPSDLDKKFSLVPRHVPTEENRAHSEIQCHKDGSIAKGKDKPPPYVRTLIRAALVHHFRFLDGEVWKPI